MIRIERAAGRDRKVVRIGGQAMAFLEPRRTIVALRTESLQPRTVAGGRRSFGGFEASLDVVHQSLRRVAIFAADDEAMIAKDEHIECPSGRRRRDRSAQWQSGAAIWQPCPGEP